MVVGDRDNKHVPLALRTHTSLWQTEKRLYKLYDVTLPVPVSLKQLGFFLGFSVPWWIMLNMLSIPFSSPWHLLWIAPPIAVTWGASRPVAEGKRLGDLCKSQIIFLTQPARFARMRPDEEPESWQVKAKVWTPTR